MMDGMPASSLASSPTFAANRAHGAVAFDVAVVDGRTRRRDLHESGSLRVRFPTPEDRGLSAVFVNTAGGIAGGDHFSTSITLAADSRLTATTAAAEKIYRSHGPSSRIDVRLKIAAGAHLSWLPQETILFDRVRAERTIDIDLAPDASLALCEIVVFGRIAMQEVVAEGRFLDRWRMRRDGRLIFADNVRLDGALSQTLGMRAVANGAVAIGTLLLVPGDEALVTQVRDSGIAQRGEVGLSAWNGFALARFCAQNAAHLRGDMIAVLKAAGVAVPRIWMS
jgi:urease accessory protein